MAYCRYQQICMEYIIIGCYCECYDDYKYYK